MTEQSDKKRERCESLEEEDLDLPEVKKLRHDLFDNLEGDEICSTSADLDSFMKSFEEEISSPNLLPKAAEIEETNLALEAVPDIGYLLEASDDELGLPPSHSGDEEGTRLVHASPELAQFGWLDENVSGFDSFEFGVENINGSGNEYVELDGLFDYSDMGFVCQPETLPAQ